MSELKKTPLYSLYKKQGVKLVDFGGWAMPVEFSSIIQEHQAVRTEAGLFDVSHMGEIAVTGVGALAFLQKMMTNDVARLQQGAVQYTAMCNQDGGTLDDLLIYKKSAEDYLLVVNAMNTDSDWAWLTSHAASDVRVENRTDDIAQLAIQGPLAEAILQKLTTFDLGSLAFFTFQADVAIADVTCLVSRTGYTGEDGFELYCHWKEAQRLWTAILQAGAGAGLMPCGLGARDTLRFEARLPLYGQELSRDITPIEAGIGYAVKIDKASDFFGKAVLKQQKEHGTKRALVGIEMVDKGIPRTGYNVYASNQKSGEVTSGTYAPTLKKNIGLAMLDRRYTEIGTEVNVQIRKKNLKAKVVKTPFYKR